MPEDHAIGYSLVKFQLMMSAQVIICLRHFLKGMQFDKFWPFCTRIYTFLQSFLGLRVKIKNMSFCTRMYRISETLREQRAHSNC